MLHKVVIIDGFPGCWKTIFFLQLFHPWTVLKLCNMFLNIYFAKIF